MSRDRILWWVGGGLIVAGAALLVATMNGCGGKGAQPEAPKVLSCLEAIVEIIETAPTCADIPKKLDRLIRAHTECVEALTGERAPYWSCDGSGDGGR